MFPDNPFVWYCDKYHFYCNSSNAENHDTCWSSRNICDEDTDIDCDLGIRMNCDKRVTFPTQLIL